MKIFFTASYHGREKYQRHYDLVLAAIKRTGAEIVSPELGNYLTLLTRRETAKLKEKDKIHREAIRRGIDWADAVIIEISQEDFQLGHEATLATQNKKHVLCLSLHEDYTTKINNRFFHGARYTEYSINKIIKSFVDTASKSLLNERLNFFLSPSQLKYLGKVSTKNGLNMSEYLRKLIDQDKLADEIE